MPFNSFRCGKPSLFSYLGFELVTVVTLFMLNICFGTIDVKSLFKSTPDHFCSIFHYTAGMERTEDLLHAASFRHKIAYSTRLFLLLPSRSVHIGLHGHCWIGIGGWVGGGWFSRSIMTWLDIQTVLHVRLDVWMSPSPYQVTSLWSLTYVQDGPLLYWLGSKLPI